MAQELATAGDRLRSALDQYDRACHFAQDTCRGGGQLNNDPELLKNLKEESTDIASYIRQLEGARAAVNAARRSIPKGAPSTNLPAEILRRIFFLVIPGQTCIVQKGYSGAMSHIKCTLFPDGLAHVCSFWRRVAITTPKLWTHIDIALDHPLNPGLFARAKIYAARAEDFPLEIHISDPGSERENACSSSANAAHGTRQKPLPEWDDLHDFKIFSSDAIPIKSLEVDLRVHDRFRESYYSMLEYFFAHCKPGILTKYAVRSHIPGWIESRPFIEPADRPYTQDGALLGVPSAHLEELWDHITIIRLGGLCPHWSSKAYHGLVELYIDEGIRDITEPQLAHILRSSPKLQVFHFRTLLDGLDEDDEVEEDDEDDENVDRIYLEDLREINLMIRDDDPETTAPRILRLITPGSAPLQLSLLAPPEDAVDFFSRANVTRLYTSFPEFLIPVFDKCLSRRFEVLAISERHGGIEDLSSLINLSEVNYDLNPGTEFPFASVSHSTTRIDTLHLIYHTKLVFEQILAVIQKYSVQKLLIYCGALSYQTMGGRTTSRNSRNIKAKISSITTGPVVEYFPDGYPERYSESEADGPDEWIRHAVVS